MLLINAASHIKVNQVTYMPDIGICGNNTQCQQIYQVKTDIVKSVLFKYTSTTHLNNSI